MAERGAWAARAGNPAGGPGFADESDSDSSEDVERPPKNTVGNVPLKWYDAERHIGYDLQGQRLERQEQRDRLDALLARNDRAAREWRTVFDEYNGETVELTKEEVRMIRRVRRGMYPSVDSDPFPVDAPFTSDNKLKQPLVDHPEPKRRFVPSKWEARRVVKLVRALRRGWIKLKEPGDGAGDADGPRAYELWDEEGAEGGPDHTAAGLSYIPAPKQRLPGHAESYNPPPEYLPTEEELRERERAWAEGARRFPGDDFVPKAFDRLRRVPVYERFVQMHFERCLDLYLCPRQRRRRKHVADLADLKPKLPAPEELEPYPKVRCAEFESPGGTPVTALACDPAGGLLASGHADGRVRVWEVATGRCVWTWDVAGPEARKAAARAAGSDSEGAEGGSGSEGEGEAEGATGRSVQVHDLAWRPCPPPAAAAAEAAGAPAPAAPLVLAAACGTAAWLAVPGAGAGSDARRTRGAALLAAGRQAGGAGAPASVLEWAEEGPGGALRLDQGRSVTRVSWHARGDYLATVAPDGRAGAVLVHQVSRRLTQRPFSKSKGRVNCVRFHPTKPVLFVAADSGVRVYDLAQQCLLRKLMTGSGRAVALDIHSGGDNCLVGTTDDRVLWFDMDLSTKPYKTVRGHGGPVRAVAFHPRHPLFASAADDARVQVFHGRVYSDLLTNPLLVPLKVLAGHRVARHAGVQALAFHPRQPWLFTAGADGRVLLWMNTKL